MKKFLSIFTLSCLIVCVALCFAGCDKATEEGVKYKVAEAGEVEIVGLSENSSVNDITIPDEVDGYPVTKICNFSLFNTEALQVIRIGKNVREIEDWALTNNKSMKEFIVDPENAYFTAVDGVLFTKDMKTLVCYPTAKNITLDRFGQTSDTATYAVPEGVEKIENRAFYRCIYLTEITLPSTLKVIGDMAFHRCSEVKTFNLPEGLTSIGRDSFSYCNAVTEITIPSTVVKIDAYAFSYSENIKKVVMKCKESDVEFGEKWYPTRDGRDMKDLEVIWE